MGWDYRDHGRTITSDQALPEDIQNFETPMVIMGSDVVSLYPNLDTNKVAERVREAVLKSEVIWENFDYLEGARYLALNWTAEQCRGSRLRKILPWRRSNKGTRPGVRGAGPKGPDRGDQEQWVFPRVTLSPEDKKEIVGTVLMIATKALFRNHYYTFNGKTFKQREGGPIGLRGTCSLARLCMQIFDVKWEERIRELRLITWLIYG